MSRVKGARLIQKFWKRYKLRKLVPMVLRHRKDIAATKIKCCLKSYLYTKYIDYFLESFERYNSSSE
jgi:hypothetical protein